MVKLPAVFLSFDDIYVDAWYDAFINSPEKVTFYPSNLATLTASQWDKLRRLSAAGHTVGCHGLGHVRAGVGVAELGAEGFIEGEITPALNLFAANGLPRPWHYAYPWGNRTVHSDAALLGVFRTLRAGGSKLYDRRGLRGRVFGAANWRRGHEGMLANLRGERAAFLYLHVPVVDRLRLLRRPGVNLYPMDVFNG